METEKQIVATINPDAIEAAAKAMWDLDREVHNNLHAWEHTTPETRAYQRRLASAALTAAAAHHGSPKTHKGGTDG